MTESKQRSDLWPFLVFRFSFAFCRGRRWSRKNAQSRSELRESKSTAELISRGVSDIKDEISRDFNWIHSDRGNCFLWSILCGGTNL